MSIFKVKLYLIMCILLVSCQTAVLADTTGSVITSELSGLITTANTALSAAQEGLGTGQYPYGSMAALQGAVASAQAVLNNTQSAQADVDTASMSLNNAMADFNAQKVSTPPSLTYGINDNFEGYAVNSVPTGSAWNCSFNLPGGGQPGNALYVLNENGNNFFRMLSDTLLLQ